MTDLTVRNVPDDVHRRLAEQAAVNGRTPEDEARVALEMQFSNPGQSTREVDWLEAVQAIQESLRETYGGKLPTGVVDEFLAQKRLIAAVELAEVERYVNESRTAGGG